MVLVKIPQRIDSYLIVSGFLTEKLKYYFNSFFYGNRIHNWCI